MFLSIPLLIKHLRVSRVVWFNVAPLLALACFGIFFWHQFSIFSKSVIKSSSVISSQIRVMSDQLRVSLYMVMSQNVM